MKGHSQNSLLMGIVFFVAVASFHLPFCVSTGKCTLENGKAVPLGSQGTFKFTCNDGYYLRGLSITFCQRYRKPQCCKCTLENGKAVPLGSQGTFKFTCNDGYYLRGLSITFCQRYHKPQCVTGCSSLGRLSSRQITYDSDMMDSLYPINTLATYQCLTAANSFKSDQIVRRCTSSGWSGGDVPCTCKGLESNTDITNIHYTPSFPQSTSGASPTYRVGTTVMYCKGTNPARRRGKRCTIDGWIDFSSTVECREPTLRQPASEPRSTTRHKEDERTLIIVSGTTGAILGALIILVIIVSCQRRIRYHRVMRARARCRQDQDAFAAFITYHRDIRFMLPSYDEAVNQQDQGRPPTFDEAVADTDRPSPNDPSSTEAEESQSLDSPNSIPTESESVVINTSDAEQALVPSVAEGRFFRGLRVLFGGQGFTTRGVYCHLVPQPDEDQDECPDNEAARLSDDAATDLNEALSRAGLC